MKLTVFQSDKGDCLLVQSGDGRHMLVDGGMRASFHRHVAPALNALHRKRKALDLVYVSHIDQDHISGVLQLFDDLVAWRVHEHQKKKGNPRHKAPKVPRPPEVRAIWNNAFHDTFRENAGDIEDVLTNKVAILSDVSDAQHQTLREAIEAQADLATSIGEALQLAQRLSPDQIKVKKNPEFAGRLMLVDGKPPPKLRLGSIRITLLGPFKADLDALRREWKKWLKENQATVDRIRLNAQRDRARLQGEGLAMLMAPLRLEAHELAQAETEALALAAREAAGKKPAARKLGRRERVTIPNLASLMLLLEEKGRRAILTGDGHAADILKGLKAAKKLDAQGRAHVDLLKVQHHGSEHNIDDAFCDAVTADHYVFCGNGAHANPDLEVVELIARRRFAGADKRRFRFSFNCSAQVKGKAKDQAHMRKIEALGAKLKRESKGRLAVSFLSKSSFPITLA